ncbi:MAG: hypothetical protein WCF15_14650 [Pseudolabrys sp.]|jgi:hypothetical protein
MKFLLVPHPKTRWPIAGSMPCPADFDRNPDYFGHALLTVDSHQARSNLLKIQTLSREKLCPQTKFAAILKL